jgi:hypothetical protein
MAALLQLSDFDETSEGLQRCWEALCTQVDRPEGPLPHAASLLTGPNTDALGALAVPQLAAIFATTQGVPGLQLLADVARTAADRMRRRYALEALWRIANGRRPPLSGPGRITAPPPEPAEQAAAARLVDDLIAEAPRDTELFGACLMLADGPDLDRDAAGSFAARFMRVSADAAIWLTQTLVDEFAALIAQQAPEADYQAFLQAHPVLLDPLAAEVLPTAPLGLEFKTDFVLRRHDDRYVVVEIEKPHDSLLTSKHDLTAAFTHAVGQVLDFQQWVADNAAYAQKSFPGIASPSGLLVMGRRDGLSERARSKLNRWQTNSRHIELVTYDELLARGTALLRSLRR